MSEQAKTICAAYFRRGDWKRCCQGCPIHCAVRVGEKLDAWVERVNQQAQELGA